MKNFIFIFWLFVIASTNTLLPMQSPTLNNQATALHRAVCAGQTETVEFLIKADKKNINVTDNKGNTPLHVATRSGHLEIIRLLIQHKANVNCQDNNGDTPLHIATRSGRIDSIKLLLQHRAKDMPNKNKETPFMIARDTRNQTAATMIVDAWIATLYTEELGLKIHKK